MWPGIEEAIVEFTESHSGYAFVDLNSCDVHNAILVKGDIEELKSLLDYFGSALINDVEIQQG